MLLLLRIAKANWIIRNFQFLITDKMQSLDTDETD